MQTDPMSRLRAPMTTARPTTRIDALRITTVARPVTAVRRMAGALAVATFAFCAMPLVCAAAPDAATQTLPSARPAAAIPPSCPPATPTRSTSADGAWTSDAATQLTRLEEQTMLLKAEIKKLDAQAEVAQRTAALSRMGTGAALDPGGQAVRVVSIEGFGHHYSAVIQTTDGQRFDVAAGDELPNGLHIVSIGANEVTGRWSGGQTARMVPVMASRSGAVLNPGTGNGSNGAAGPGSALVPVDRNAPPGLPPGYPSAQ